MSSRCAPLLAALFACGCYGSQAGIGPHRHASGGTGTGGGNATGGSAPGSGGMPAATGGTGGSSTGTGGGVPPIIGWATPVPGGPSGTGTAATVKINTGAAVGRIGPDFAGFSYEKTHLMNGSLTSNNKNLIALYKLLGAPLTRIGANDVERCTWTGTGPAPSQPNGKPFAVKVTTGGVDQFCGFLAATGSKAIYGVNFQLGNVTASAAEAAYVMSQCASSILGFEIGNEPDKFGTWAAQQADWESFADAILATPGAMLVGPACTTKAATPFTAPFADDIAAKYPGKLAVLSQHTYVAAANSSDCSVPNLQITTSKLTDAFDVLQAAAVKNGLPDWRMDENNTCSGHGQQGVSDTFISSLWAIDYMFEVAKRGGSGVNFHTSENGMDGTVPFYYEPLREDQGMVVQVQPEYYGLLLFAEAGAGALVSTSVTTGAQNFTAWAIQANGGFVSVVLNNRNASTGVSATLNLGAAVTAASAIYLQATPAGSLTAPAGSVTLAGAQVSAAGEWPRNPPYVQTVSGSSVAVYVPPASAALVRVVP
ncbi:MAG TPA: glycosyl hydrolase family 79 C-terminal domain-containing protein [Polyangia bacterium]|nr:glycosyl hydrolase family 79 C-terminal domain-containing protein [Polyangia bacterium]